MTIDLSKLDIKELKSMAYDQLVISEQSAVNLKVINEEIKRQQSQPAPVQPQVEAPQVEEAVIKEETK